ncbi:hypothetical protein SAMN05192569_100179 [Parageobacillus thermantarcticus]|uniref:Uncharacterized protein n=1 Tax=Parageobacillus thermantarcticus TaxID=186116 RepID=A0A1I0SFX8_9BACL|nr:hypothetical protein SAMN05192569_100179 [Parageobacillus thermantarcticus]
MKCTNIGEPRITFADVFIFLRLRWTARMNEGVGGLIKNVEQLRFL